jgi:hypothetical protein
MKNKIITTLAFAALLSSASAASLLSTNFGNGFTLSNGTTALGTGAVRFGTIAAGFDFVANANNISAINAAFTEVYALTGTIEALSTPGFFDINTTYNNTAFEGVNFDNSAGTTTNVAGDIAGEKVYVWALNNATTASATQHGIFSTNTLWTDFDTVGNNDTLFSPDTGNAGLTAHIGSLASGADIGGGAPSHSLANIAAIPEPSRAMLGFIGLAAMVFRRRRA